MTAERLAHCCYISDPPEALFCQAPAEWVVVHGPNPEDYTHACTAHVGHMLTDSYLHIVFPIARPILNKAGTGEPPIEYNDPPENEYHAG